MTGFAEAPIPKNEVTRLERLRSYRLLDTSSEQDFDDFTRLASRLLGVPIALVSLVDDKRQWFKSRVGLDTESTPREVSFCGHAILAHELFVVEDAASDERFSGNPLVTGSPEIRFYAGAPLVSGDGSAIGTLCVIDHKPRKLSAEDRETLLLLARQLTNLLELRRSKLQQDVSNQLLDRQTTELKRLALITERTHNVVILADADGLITWVNPAFERVTGYTLEEAIGSKPGSLLQCEDTCTMARQQLRDAVSRRAYTRVHILNKGKQGNRYWMDVELQPLYEAGEEFIGFVAVETDITALVTQQQHLDTLIEAVPVGLAVRDGKQSVTRFNSAARRILAGAREDEHIHVAAQVEALMGEVDRGLTGRTSRLLTLKDSSEQTRWLNVCATPLPTVPGVSSGEIVSFYDQTEQILAGNYIELAAQTAELGYWTWSLAEDLVELSGGWVERMGLRSSLVSSRDLVHPEDQARARQEILKVLRGERQSFKFEERLRAGDGRWVWVMSGGAIMERDAEGRALRLAGIHVDIDDRKQTELALERAATSDPLTGLPNRLVLLDRLSQSLSAARRLDQYGALLYLDLDHFKRINDSYGHSAGDELLIKVAARLSNQLREEDTLARMGGDEMMVLLPRLGGDLAVARAHANAIAQKLINTLESPIELQDRLVVVGASVGLTLFPKIDLEDPEDLVREADTAMYAAKYDTRGSVRFYEPTMRHATTSRLELDNELRRAVEEGLLELFMQGKWTPAGALVGGELLLRWKHPKRGWISPAEFIPIAEESELIQQIGRWVLMEAVQIAAVIRKTNPDFVVAVNVSPKQFKRDEFTHDLKQCVADAGLPPQALMLEITEGVLLQEQLARSVVALTEEGYRFSLDDFGTGYSSLAYLKRLPVHELKIDKAFVRDIETDPDDAVLVQAILSIARRFKIQTVAEGIESPAQMDFLAANGCGVLQGYFFDKPQPWRFFIKQFCRLESEENWDVQT